MAQQNARSHAEWLEKPEEHDFLAALDYLALVFPEADAARVAEELRDAPVIARKAKDLLRASRLELLPKGDFEVRRDLKKVAAGEKLSPVLLVRGRGADGVPMTIADGYHRVCASYHLSEDTPIACCLVDAP